MLSKPAPPPPKPPPAPKPPAPAAPKVKVELPPKVEGQPVVSVPTKKPHKKKADDLDGTEFLAYALLGVLIVTGLVFVVLHWLFER